MTATQTVAHESSYGNSDALLFRVPTSGVVTLFGYGITVRVDRGHLVLQDGIGADRRHFRLPRVGHRLKRLVIIGTDGIVSLAALRWLTDQNAAFIMLERDGSIVTITGPASSSDARLRKLRPAPIFPVRRSQSRWN